MTLERVIVWPMAERTNKTWIHLADPGWQITGLTICRLPIKESGRDEPGPVCPACADVEQQRQQHE